jgi:uncharacterized protein
MSPNPFLLAADNSPVLLPLLRENPGLASAQDEHGYSLVHAAASYDHLDLLRTLVQDLGVDVNIKDEDGETALFVVETVAAAKVLVEELGVDISIAGLEGLTAQEKIEAEAEYLEVAAYLASLDAGKQMDNSTLEMSAASAMELPPAPEGLAISVRTMSAPDTVLEEVDSEFKKRIDELAEREDFHTAEGQAELRRLVEDAIAGQALGDERNVRQRQS